MGFAVLGLFSFGLACAVLLVRPDALTGEPVRGLVLALTHLITLGWIGSLLFAGAYLFGPVLAGAPMWSERLPAWHLLAHVAGLGMLVGGLARQDYSLAGVGGLVLCVGLVLLIWNLQLTGNRKSLWTPAHMTFQAALFWLAVTGGVAIYMLRNRVTGESMLPAEMLIALHAHFALFGFLAQALLGVSLRMIPRLLDREEEAGSPLAWAGWCFLNLGLFLIFPVALAQNATAVMVAGACMGLGIFLYALQVLAYLLRHRENFSWGVATHATGIFLLALITLAALVRFPYLQAGSPEEVRAWMRMYISLSLLGPFAFAILGTSERMLPRMIWALRFGPWSEKGKVPPPQSLALSAAGGPIYFCLLLAWGYLAYGQWTEQADAIRIGSILLLAGFAWFVVGVSPALVRLLLGVTPEDIVSLPPDSPSATQTPNPKIQPTT